MNTYSRALRYINMGDVKQKHQQKLIEEKQQRKLEREEKKYIQSVMKEIKYDWRKKLNEGMTSSGTFFTTLPAAGDVDLATVSASEYQVGLADGIDVGDDFGNNYLQFTGAPASGDQNDPRYVVLNPIDTTNYTTITLSVIKGQNTGTKYTKQPGRDLSVYWYRPGGGAGLLGTILKTSVSSSSPTSIPFNLPSGARGPGLEILVREDGIFSLPAVGGQQYVGESLPSIHPSTFNSTVAGWVDGLLYYYPNITNQQKIDYGYAIWNALQDSYVGNWPGTPGYPSPIEGLTTSINSEEQTYISNLVISTFAATHRKFATTYGISFLGLRRRTPVNVFVPLDSPESTAFIRTEPNLSNLSPEEKNKKLREMLNASDEYLEKMLGVDFPGTGAVPPGEFDPFAQPAPGDAGDTPGVDVTDMSNLIAGGAGYIPPYVQDWEKLGGGGRNTNPNRGGGSDRWDPNDPSTWPSIKNQVKQASDDQNKKNVVVAHYEPQGEVITERKKLKSLEDVLNKIPGYYDGKPAPLGFPVEQPPKMVNGMHPDLVDGKKTADRFNRMDPESAKAMPLTGNPHIDKKVKAARKKPK